jgi:hypothetical protein
MEQSELLRHLVGTLESLGLQYFVTGSIATIYYAEPRFTHDIDVVVDLPPARIEAFCRAFPAPEYYSSRDAIIEAITHNGQFNIYHPASGLKIDVMIPEQSEFNRTRFERRRRVQPAPALDAWFTSPEDAILKKLQYYAEGGSDKHLRDIASMLKISPDQIDVNYVEEWAGRLGVVQIWHAIRQQTG